ncbi:MAG: DUF3253 domain-containing protein [Burkholderiaceae bacterium]
MHRPGPPTAPAAAPAPHDAESAALRNTLHAALLRMTRERGPQASLCPSEVARQVAAGTVDADWRSLMPAVRAAAGDLARTGQVEVLQRGQKQNPDGPWRGPIRVRWVKDD